MNRKILIVEDSAVQGNVIKRVVDLARFNVGEVFLAADGNDALTILAENEVDLIVTNLNMPRMDGLEMLREIRKRETHTGVPVLVISANTTDSRREALMDLGVGDCISKPFRREKLRDTLAQYLENMDR